MLASTDSSVPQPVPSHLFGVLAATGLYLGYAGVGKAATGHNAFWWLDEELAGSKEKVAGYATAFVSLAAACECAQWLDYFPKCVLS